jgi:hypothetical protein
MAKNLKLENTLPSAPDTLALGLSIMILLMFGTCIVQDWQIAGLQQIYGLSYAALLFALFRSGARKMHLPSCSNWRL